MTVITRFAPSPTGDLHIGGARTALFNYLFAKKNQGKFLLRIEDTDKKRSTKEAIDAILQGMNWLELEHDEDVVFQTQNENRHVQIAQKLLADGKAYLCYTSSEELSELRKNAEKEGKILRFRSKWRDLKQDQKSQSEINGVKPVVRIKAPIAGELVINDLVQGEVKVQNSEIDDFVILRADGTPTYMLSCVVDDYDMKITHVIRGDDHLNNAFKQKLIYESLGWNCPKFAHIPLIHGSDGAKLSKRHGATSVIEYKNMGYLPEAMRNYLLRLGWSYGDEEIICDQKAQEIFDVKNIGKSPSRFDFAKLNFVNKHYIKEKNEDDLLDLCADFFFKEISKIEKIRIKQAINFVKERADLLNKLAQDLEIYFDNYKAKLSESDAQIVNLKKDLAKELLNLFESINEEDWNLEVLKVKINDFANSKSIKIKDFGPLLRILLTYTKSSPGGVFDIVAILGKKEVLRRFSEAL